MNFIEKYKLQSRKANSLLCVGIDPDLSKIPECLKSGSEPIFEFCKAIVDATHDIVCAYKPQIAYFANQAEENQLTKIIDYIQQQYPHIPIILDAKRGDIGSTASKYAEEAFVRYGVDAVTINPYMGFDSVQPFLDYESKGVIILCRTSNSGASDFQDMMVGDQKLYLKVASVVAKEWNYNNNCLLVVGATWPEQMEEVRQIVGDIPFLVPGIGVQGGDIAGTIKLGNTSDGLGLIMSSSRAILYADASENFAVSARKVALESRDNINKARGCA